MTARIAQVMAWWDSPENRQASQAESVRLDQHAAQKPDGTWYFTGSQPGAEGLCQSARDITRAVEADATLAVLNNTQDFVTIHGALLARDGSTILIIGPSMSGKSTLACRLWLDGWDLLGDDVTRLMPSIDGNCRGIALPRRVSLRSTSRTLLPPDKWEEIEQFPTSDATDEGLVFHPADTNKPAQQFPLKAIVFLQRTGANRDTYPKLFSPVHPADALLAACTYTNLARKNGLGESIPHLALLLDNIPAFDLARADIVYMSEAITALHDKLQAQS